MLTDYEVAPTVVCKLMVLSSIVPHLRRNISISSENREVDCSELNQHTLQRNHEGTTFKLHCCSKSIAGVDISYCFPRVNS